MSMETRRRAGIVALLALLAGALLLAIAPMHAASIRLGGVSLLWWYAAAVVPVTGVIVAVASLSTRTP